MDTQNYLKLVVDDIVNLAQAAVDLDSKAFGKARVNILSNLTQLNTELEDINDTLKEIQNLVRNNARHNLLPESKVYNMIKERHGWE